MVKRAGRVRRYDPNTSRSGMASVTVEALLLGIDLGWEATEMRNGMIQLRSPLPDVDMTINLPTNQRSIKQSVSDTWMRKLIHYADPMKVAYLYSITTDMRSDNELERARGERAWQKMKSSEIVENPDLLTGYLHKEGENDPEPEPEPDPEPDELVGPEGQVATKERPDEPHVVKVKPWIAKHHMGPKGGQVYESKAVLERKWSDGTTDYKCPMCDYTHPMPRSVSSHYAGTHSKEQPAKQSEAEMFTDPALAWTPTERQAGRITRLAKEMEAAWKEIGPDMTTHQCAEWIVKKRDAERDSLTDDVSPLTPEQVLERVRKLVDGGAYADLLARMEEVEGKAAASVEEMRERMRQHDTGATNAVHILEQRLTELEEACQQAQNEAEAAHAREVEAVDRWQALVELVNASP